MHHWTFYLSFQTFIARFRRSLRYGVNINHFDIFPVSKGTAISFSALARGVASCSARRAARRAAGVLPPPFPRLGFVSGQGAAAPFLPVQTKFFGCVDTFLPVASEIPVQKRNPEKAGGAFRLRNNQLMMLIARIQQTGCKGRTAPFPASAALASIRTR